MGNVIFLIIQPYYRLHFIIALYRLHFIIALYRLHFSACTFCSFYN